MATSTESALPTNTLLHASTSEVTFLIRSPEPVLGSFAYVARLLPYNATHVNALVEASAHVTRCVVPSPYVCTARKQPRVSPFSRLGPPDRIRRFTAEAHRCVDLIAQHPTGFMIVFLPTHEMTFDEGLERGLVTVEALCELFSRYRETVHRLNLTYIHNDIHARNVVVVRQQDGSLTLRLTNFEHAVVRATDWVRPPESPAPPVELLAALAAAATNASTKRTQPTDDTAAAAAATHSPAKRAALASTASRV